MENGVEKMPRGSKSYMSCMYILVVNKRDIDFQKRNILQYLVACKPDCCSHINIMRNNDEVRHKDSI